MSGLATLAHWGEAARPRTLAAAVAPVMVATALAWQDRVFEPRAASLCLAFALLIQIGTNYANDYFDFKKGADTEGRVGPRRAVAAGLIAPAAMRRATAIVFGVAFLVGLGLLPYGGWPLLIVGMTSILCGVAYTGGPYPLAYHGWGDVFVFVFFGLVAVTATYFVQAGMLTPGAWWLGVMVGALSTNILVVNNYRDIETDRVAGKRTLAVRWGPGFAQGQFAGGHALVLLALGMLWRQGRLDGMETVGLGVFGAVTAGHQLYRLKTATSPAALIQLLGTTGRHVALTGLLLGLALVR